MTKDAKNGFNHDLIRDLANLLKETDLSEIEIENDDLRIRVARSIQVTAPVYSAPAVRRCSRNGPCRGRLA